MLANKIAKSFAEAKFIKDCMIDAVSVVCPEVKSKVEAISLSRGTIVRRIDAIAVNIQEQLLTASVGFQWLSIALDERTDIQDTAQLLIYLRGIDENFERLQRFVIFGVSQRHCYWKRFVEQCH